MEKGNLVAQISQQAMVVEYEGRSITQDPFILSNSKPIKITFGSEKITVPPFARNPTNILWKPEGNFSLLEAAMNDIPWREYWESFMPIDSRQMLLLAVAIAQAITMWPSLLKIIYCFMGCFGFALRPPEDRTYIRRYQIGTDPRNVPDLEAQEMNPLNDP